MLSGGCLDLAFQVVRGGWRHFSENKKRRPHRSPLFSFQSLGSQFLELESDSDLNLPLAEERTVGCGDCAELGIEVQRAADKVVHRAVYAGDQQGVRQIERLAKELQVRLFLDVEAA